MVYTNKMSNFLKDMFTNHYYKFFIVKGCNESKLVKLDVIEANRTKQHTMW